MIYFNITQKLMKYAISITFRILIVVYAIFLLFVNDNFFNMWLYAIYIFTYLFMYKKLMDKKQATLRTFNDYIFITLILLGKDIEIFYNAILLILPLFNAPNHTAKNKKPIVLFLISLLDFFILYYVYNDTITLEILLYASAAVLSLYLISLFEYYRSDLNSRLLNIFTEIDNIMSNKKSTSQLMDVYSFIKIKFQEDLHFSIDDILVFEDNKRHTNIRSSSKFIHTYNIDEVKKELKDNNVLYNKIININNTITNNATIIKVNSQYIFIVIMKSEVYSKSILKNIYLSELLIPIFKKIIKIIEFENLLSKEKYRMTQELNKKSHFVNNIMKSTHYFSNQLSSITNYFVIKEDMISIKKEEVKIEALEILNDEEKRARRALNNIKAKTLKVLDKENNPFVPKEKQLIKYKRLYMIIKPIWMQYFYENEINTLGLDGQSDKRIKNLNVITLEFIFADLFENIRKHGIGNKSILFDFSGDNVKIKISNNIRDYESRKKKLSLLIKNFNDSDRLEINKRQSYGLSHIKELSDIMNIRVILEINKELFTTNLTFLGEVE